MVTGFVENFTVGDFDDSLGTLIGKSLGNSRIVEDGEGALLNLFAGNLPQIGKVFEWAHDQLGKFVNDNIAGAGESRFGEGGDADMQSVASQESIGI